MKLLALSNKMQNNFFLVSMLLPLVRLDVNEHTEVRKTTSQLGKKIHFLVTFSSTKTQNKEGPGNFIYRQRQVWFASVLATNKHDKT